MIKIWEKLFKIKFCNILSRGKMWKILMWLSPLCTRHHVIFFASNKVIMTFRNRGKNIITITFKKLWVRLLQFWNVMVTFVPNKLQVLGALLIQLYEYFYTLTFGNNAICIFYMIVNQFTLPMLEWKIRNSIVKDLRASELCISSVKISFKL